ncbi:hypothetical protein HZ326_29632 [Fusarium oxysporum f. sp. albedinis]|nr:hypothetical protein HZ326_29632 [Fusarium oxysporum f. sp. albedinis]
MGIKSNWKKEKVGGTCSGRNWGFLGPFGEWTISQAWKEPGDCDCGTTTARNSEPSTNKCKLDHLTA